MGCVSSSPEKAAPERLPDPEQIKETPAQKIKGEPALLLETDDSMMTKTATTIAMRQTGNSKLGSTWEISKDTTSPDPVIDYVVMPAFGFGGQIVRRQLQDLVKLVRKDDAERALCYCVKSVEQGPEIFKVLVDRPLKENQSASIFKGPDGTKLYIYASVEFDMKTRICAVRLHGQGKTVQPLYTIRQCTADTWILKKNDVNVSTMKCLPGLMPKFHSYEVLVSPNMDLAFVICLTNIIDWFRDYCAKITFKYYK